MKETVKACSSEKRIIQVFGNDDYGNANQGRKEEKKEIHGKGGSSSRCHFSFGGWWLGKKNMKQKFLHINPKNSKVMA